MFPTLTRDDVFRIETPRLWMRWPRLEDAAGLAHWSGRPEVATMTSTFRVAITPADMAVKISQNRAANSAGRSLSFVIVPQDADRDAIGMLGVHVQPGGRLELGYHLDPAHWGRGLMTEAVRALAAQVFELTAAAKIDAGVRPANIGSVRVLEKSGFVATGTAEHESPLYGRYTVTQFALTRRRPSALQMAHNRRQAAATRVHDLVGLV